MYKFNKKYKLDNKIFRISKNVGEFPANIIKFSSSKHDEIIMGTLSGVKIINGKFFGRFISPDYVELLYQWHEIATLILTSGRLVGYICENKILKLNIYVNWYSIGNDLCLGSASFSEL